MVLSKSPPGWKAEIVTAPKIAIFIFSVLLDLFYLEKESSTNF